MTVYKGACHCGAVTVELETDTAPATIDVRECQCSFCRAHGAESASDPAGRIRYIDDESPGFSTTQIRHFEDRALFTKSARHPDYDEEPLESRLARRRKTWTPIADL